MTYIITSPCVDVMDIACVDVCPVDCIYHEKGVDRSLYIQPDECIDCAACEPVCPVTAIFAEADVPAGEKEFVQLNKDYFNGKDAVRKRIAAIGDAKPKKA